MRLRVGLVLWSVVAASEWGVAQTVPEPSSVGQQQQTGSEQSVPVNRQSGAYALRLNSQLAILDVVVTDEKGAVVSGLTRDDFTVFEDKVQQQIVSVEEVRAAAPSAVRIHSTAELDRLEPHAPVSILVIDEATTKSQDEFFVREALQKYLASEGDALAQPTMLLAVSVEHQMLLHDYTTSKKEILDALNQHFNGRDWHAGDYNFQGQQMMATLLSLMGVAGATSGHEGHKNIVWVGRGFPRFQWNHLPLATAEQFQQAIATCTNRLRDARVTLYSVDPAGMPAGAPIVHADADALETPGAFVIEDPFGGQVDFDAMARATGGMGLHGNKDLDRLIGDGVSYGGTFYTIAYKPEDPGTDPEKFRSVHVFMADRRLAARAPEGYFSGVAKVASAMDPKGKVPTEVAQDLAVATDGLMVYDAVPLTIERAKDKPDDFRVSFPASAVAWASDGAQDKGDITLLVSSYDRKGKLLHHDGHVIGFVRQPLTEKQVEGRILHVPATVDSATPAVRIRVIVRVNGNGKIGTGNYFLAGGTN